MRGELRLMGYIRWREVAFFENLPQPFSISLANAINFRAPSIESPRKHGSILTLDQAVVERFGLRIGLGQVRLVANASLCCSGCGWCRRGFGALAGLGLLLRSVGPNDLEAACATCFRNA
jgi:hypothetical protein